MLASTLCFALQGVDGQPVYVETDVSSGAGSFSIVGLPDAAVRESKDRVTGALRNSGYAVPSGRITINLSPADLRKEGSVFDLPIAVSIIAEILQTRYERNGMNMAVFNRTRELLHSDQA